MSATGANHSEVNRVLSVIDIRTGEFQHFDVSAYGGTLNHVPFGPLSWTSN